MEVTIATLDQGEAGTIELSPAVFGQPVRADILQQVVRWQQAKRRQGTHKTKTRGEIKATTRKMYKQKGTGRARHGAATTTQFRGGGKSFGPVPRDHAHSLPKKVRKLGLKVALSSKLAEGKLVVLDQASLGGAEDQAARRRGRKMGLEDGAGDRWRRARSQLHAGGAQPGGAAAAADRGRQCVRHPAA